MTARERPGSLVNWLPAALCAVGLLLAGCGEGGGSASGGAGTPSDDGIRVTEEMVDRGAELYAETCSPCHGPRGKGNGPAAAHMNPKPRDHTDQGYMDTVSDAAIRDIIRYGGESRGYPLMPAVPRIRGDDLPAVVAFVRSLSRGREAVIGSRLELESTNREPAGGLPDGANEDDGG